MKNLTDTCNTVIVSSDLKAEYRMIGMSKSKFPVIALVFQRLWNFSLSLSLFVRVIFPYVGKISLDRR